MGTRHLIAVVADGKFRVAQYGQWDGYPEGQGVGILKYLRKNGTDKLRAGLEFTFEATGDDFKRFYAEVGHDVETSDGWISYDKAKKFGELYPSLSRDTGYRILSIVASARPDGRVPLKLSAGFAGDSLFCEWAYVIDLDAGTFEVFEGFNKTPTPSDSRFPSGADWLEKTDGYEPVALAASYDLSALPAVEDFLSALTKTEDEEA